MIRILLIFGVFLGPIIGGFNTSLWAQTGSITGQVTDHKSDALASATVVVLNAADSIYVSFALTDEQGIFNIPSLNNGNYILQFTYLGYKQKSLNTEISEVRTLVDLDLISLTPINNQIEEIIVKGEVVPIEVKKDTLVYNANAFQTQPNDLVEDLLRKMPGIEVESDGTITAQGETVEKVLVDGKEFFGSDTKIATKNLPAKAIDKIQFYDRKSDRAEFTGIDDGEREKTMNLELKEEYKKGYFGNVAAGYGTDDRRNVTGSINRFDKKMRLSVLGNLNNINQQGFSTADYRNFMGSMGGMMGRDASSDNSLSDGFVNTNAGGLNLNYDFAEKTKLNVAYFINDIENDISTVIRREYFLDETEGYFSNDDQAQINSSINHRINSQFDHEIDSTQNLRLKASLVLNEGQLDNNTYNNVELLSSLIENESTKEYRTVGNSNQYSGGMTYRKKLGESRKRIFTLETSLNDLSDETTGNLDSEITFKPYDPLLAISELIAQRQLQTNNETNYSILGSYVEPLGGGRYLEFSYRRQNYNTDLVRDVYDNIGGMEDFNLALSNDYTRDFTYDRYGLTYQWNTEQTNFSAEANVQQSHLDGVFNLTQEKVNFDNLAFLPRISLRHEIATGRNISVRYSTSVNEPSLDQLQPIINNSDPLNIYIGNPDLKTEYRHSLRANYIHFDQFSFRSLFAFFTANYSRNKITNQTIINDRFVKTTTPVNVEEDLTMNLRLNYSMPIRALGMKIRVSSRLGYSNSILFINTIENDVNRYSSNLGLTLENRDKEYFDLSVGGRWTYQDNIYSVSSNQNFNFLNQNYNTRASITAIKNWNLESTLDVDIYSQQAFGEAQTIPIWSASLSRYLLENNRLEIKLSVFDLLNKNQGVDRSSELNYIENSVSNSLGRYGMLSAIYRLSAYGEESSGGRGGRPRF